MASNTQLPDFRATLDDGREVTLSELLSDGRVVFFFYPKAAVSYRVVRPLGGVDEIKFRGAFGQTGNQPLFGAKFSSDTTGNISGIYGNFPPNRIGDPNIKP